MNTWKITIDKYVPEQNQLNETMFSQANGYMGIRGYTEEGIPGQESIPKSLDDDIASSPQQYIAGYFDKSPVTGNTMVNIPTLKLIYIYLDGEKLDLAVGKVTGYSRSLDFKTASTTRTYIWESPKGKKTKLEFFSFLSYAQHHIYCTQVKISPLNWTGNIRLQDTFDCTGKTLRDYHYDVVEFGDLYNGHFCEISTKTSRLNACFTTGYKFSTSVNFADTIKENDKIVREINFSANEGDSIKIERFLAAATDFDKDKTSQPIKDRTLEYLQKALNSGIDELLTDQRKAWDALWEDANIAISGDPEREQKVRFSIFQLLQAYRVGDSRLNIGAKFLSGDHYAGHFFWDTEIFIFPFYLHVMPEAAQNLIECRINSLYGAKRKAERKGCKGAFFPWEATPIDDDENCPEYWKDKDKGETVYIPCGDIELHINSAVVYAANQYLLNTGKAITEVPGMVELFIETARFWASRGEWYDNAYVIKNVIGPDEYHEFIDNNAYTNHTAKWNIQKAVNLVKEGLAEVAEAELMEWQKIIEGIKLGYEDELGIIAQDDTYLALPEFGWAKRDGNKPLYKYMNNEIIASMQITKQADVLALFHLFPFSYDYELMSRCWNYYEPRTAHDSNLSAGTHAMVANLLDKPEDALKYYDTVLNLDLGYFSFNTREGLHAANAGNAWGITVIGFCGIRMQEDKLICSPKLPATWDSISFVTYYHGRRLQWQIGQSNVRVEISAGKRMKLDLKGEMFDVGEQEAEIKSSLSQ